MKRAAAHTTTKSASGKSGDDRFVLGTLATDFLDTTWRIAVPVILFAGLGILLDRQLGSSPWLTLLLTILGFVIAGMLIRRQLNAAALNDQASDNTGKESKR